MSTMTTHSTIETTRSGDLVRRFECSCGFVLETPWNGVNPRLVAGDAATAHTGDWQVPALALR